METLRQVAIRAEYADDHSAPDVSHDSRLTMEVVGDAGITCLPSPVGVTLEHQQFYLT